ncbi:hypothetical protein SLS60_002402 [Paraconiothyrium brasiliense]|uniref:Uncharacterized protein n=1 Tax=Paraconiothyrium brasiliense TaxID=300254 RepID=A0ABR3S272_9PLEO
MSAFQQTSDVQQRSQTTLTQIWAYAIARELDHVLRGLPPFTDYEFTVVNGAPALNIGCVYPTNAGDCTLHSHKVPHTDPNYSKNFTPPRHDWVEDMGDDNKARKGVFAWHSELYEGLFQGPMQPRSAALLQYHLLQWVANTSGAVDVVEEINVDALCEALQMVEETEEFEARAQKNGGQQLPGQQLMEQQTTGQQLTEISTTNGSMEVDQHGRHDANRISNRTLLDEIKTSVPIVASLPTLQELNVVFEPHNRDENVYLPLRLYIGESRKNNKCKVWMYMTHPQGKKQGLSQPCEMEIIDDNGDVVGTKTLATGWARDLDAVTLDPPFDATKKAKGHNYLPLTYVTQYCFLLKYEEEGISIDRDLIVINVTFKRYLENGVKFYQQGSTSKSKSTTRKANPKWKAKSLPDEQKATMTTRKKSINYAEESDEEENYSYTPSATALRLLERSKAESSKGKEATGTTSRPPSLPPATNEGLSDAESADIETPGSITQLKTADELGLRETQLQNKIPYSIIEVHQHYRHWRDVRENIPEELLAELYEASPRLELAEKNLSDAMDTQIDTWEEIQEVVARMNDLGFRSQWEG